MNLNSAQTYNTVDEIEAKSDAGFIVVGEL